jgi:DNA polymerase-3 subunit delta'
MNPIVDTAEFVLLPWHRALWLKILQARSDGRLHHALLIAGMRGMGKTQLARNLAHSLLCRSPDAGGIPCGSCRGCRLCQAGNHPDLREVGPDPESKSGEIKIEAIRNLVQEGNLCAHSGGCKVVIIAPAERMNGPAANSLLKTLEEPTPSTQMVLVSARPGRLLPTIRSRCQQLHLMPPRESEALAWLRERSGVEEPLLALRLANGAPLEAERLLLDTELLQRREQALDAFLALGEGRGDPVATAGAWMKMDLPLLFEWLGGWVADILRLGSRHPVPRLTNPDRAEQLARQSAGMSPVRLHRFWQRVVESGELLQTNLNPQLMLESLLAQWSDMRR